MKSKHQFIRNILAKAIMIFITIVATGLVLNQSIKATSVDEVKISNSSAYIHVDFENGYWEEADPLGYGYYTIDGQVGFCVEPNDFNRSSGYQTQAFQSESVRKYLSEIAYYGWDLSPQTYRDYILTQNLIWDVLINELETSVYTHGQWRKYQGGWITSSYNGEDLSTNSAAYQDWKAGILAKVNGSVAFNQSTLTLTAGESATVTDTNGMLQYLHLRGNSANVDVTHNGNSVTITARTDSDNGTVKFYKTSESYANNSQSTLFYKGSNGQDLVTLKLEDPDYASLNVIILKEDHIWIKKVNPQGEPIPGTVFKLSLNPDFSGNTWNYTTKEDGWADADIWNMIGRTVYIKEESVPSPYVKSDEVKSVKLVGDKTHEITFVNETTHHRILKKSLNSDEILAGAKLQLIHKANNQVVLEWESSNQPQEFTNLTVGETYVLKEVTAPEGYFLAESIEFTVDNTAIPIDHVLYNELKPSIQTTATVNGEKEVHALGKITLVDKVEYKNLLIGKEYQVKGQLVRKDNQAVLAEAELLFTPEQKDGFVELTFEFDTSQLAGQEVVAFEKVYRDNVEVANHIDLKDEVQTVRVVNPSIKTQASINKRGLTDLSKVKIMDKVFFKDLIIGKQYQVKGILMDQATNKPFLDNGKEITSELTFVASTKEGVVELPFIINASNLKKGKVVVFEDLYQDDMKLYSHADINDVDQTVTFTEIKILKVDSTDPNKVLKDAEFTLYLDGQPIQTAVTDENGIATFVVENGKYELKETKAPSGYQLSTGVIDITVTGGEMNHVLSITHKNDLLPKQLIETGYLPSLWLSLGGLSLILAGYIMIHNQRKEE